MPSHTAEEVTAGAANNYERAVLLQNWFKSKFRYSLEVQPGHGNNAIEGFLRDRVGYCEQFAGTYAAMMRSLGIPARVAVGFTTGKATGTGYSVTGRNAHAWPEVWFDGLGWVLFEPTPGRGAPGAESYTGLDPAQDTSTGSEGDGQGDQPVPEEPAAAEPPTGPTTLPPIPEEDAAPATPIPADPVEPASSDSGNDWILLALLGAAALAVAAPPIGRRIRRRSTRSPSEQVANNWERAIDALRLVDVPIVSSATPAETALVTVRTFPDRVAADAFARRHDHARHVRRARHRRPRPRGGLRRQHGARHVALGTPDRTSGQRFGVQATPRVPLLHPLEVSRLEPSRVSGWRRRRRRWRGGR